MVSSARPGALLLIRMICYPPRNQINPKEDSRDSARAFPPSTSSHALSGLLATPSYTKRHRSTTSTPLAQPNKLKYPTTINAPSYYSSTIDIYAIEA
jgi:hypothetical protein